MLRCKGIVCLVPVCNEALCRIVTRMNSIVAVTMVSEEIEADGQRKA